MLIPVLAGLGALSLMSNPRRRRRKAKRRNPGPTAKNIRLLVLLQNELALAENRYEKRTYRDDARKLRRAAVEARLRYRRFFRAMEAKTRSNPGRPVAKPTTERRAYQLGYAEGRDATGDMERRGGWPTPSDLSGTPNRLTIAWKRGNNAGRAKMMRQRSNPHRSVVLRRGKKALGVKNLRWLLVHWRDVKNFVVTPYRGSRNEMIDAVLTAKLRDGSRYRSTYASKTILWSWLQRPVFLGIPVRWFGRNVVITKRATLPNPGTVSRTSLTDAEAAIKNKAMLGTKRSGAWAMSHANAKKIANQLRHGFKALPSSHGGLYLVTDGHWYVG